MTEPPFAGTFIVKGGTTENSMGLWDSCCCSDPFLLSRLSFEDDPLDDLSLEVVAACCGPHITADNFAKLNSTSISYDPRFLKGRRNFWAPVPCCGPFLTTRGTTLSLLYSVINSSRWQVRGPGTSTFPARSTSSLYYYASFLRSRRNSFMLLL